MEEGARRCKEMEESARRWRKVQGGGGMSKDCATFNILNSVLYVSN